MEKIFSTLLLSTFCLSVLSSSIYSQQQSNDFGKYLISLKESDKNILLEAIDSLSTNKINVEETIPFLIERLSDSNPSVCWHASTALSKIGEEAIPSLINVLGNENKKIVCAATRALGEIGSKAKDAIPLLIKNLKNKNNDIKESAVIAVGKIGTTDSVVVKSLIELFFDPDPFINGEAATSLSRIGKTTVPFLINSIKIVNENVRRCSAIALGKIGKDAKEAEETLVQLLDNESDNIRYAAVYALENLENLSNQSVTALIKKLDDKNEDVRWSAVKVLENFPMPKSGSDVKKTRTIIDSLTPVLMKKFKVPGVSIAIINKRNLFWSECFGVSDVRTNKPVTKETMFEACSMTKPVFAYTVMKLVEDGKLDLDRPLVEYTNEPLLPDQQEYKFITARMVLSHTTGFPNWRNGEEERDGPLPVKFKPGTRFSYSGEGFYFLQKVIEKIVDEPLELFAKRKLFDEMNLKHFSYVWTEELDSLISCGHDTNGTFLRKTSYTHANAAYTLYTSAEDYALFLIEIMKQDRSAKYSLSQKSIDLMLTKQIDAGERTPVVRPDSVRGLNTYWSLGWCVNTTLSGEIFHHSGANGSGFRCFCQFDPVKVSGIVIMTNSLNGSELWNQLIKEVGDL
jgi:CubicO group peptidase (beta-lactamase class C family)/HEAT repeat protein